LRKSDFEKLKSLKSLASRFARYIYFRSMSSANSALAEVARRTSKLGDAGRGFYEALRGIQLAVASFDQNSFYLRLYKYAEPSEIEALRDKFTAEILRETADAYERGYALAWSIVLETMAKLKVSHPPEELASQQR